MLYLNLTRVVDLLDVFTGGYVYNKNIGGSFNKINTSCTFPNEAGLNYKNLENVQNGTDAKLCF